MQRVKLPVCIAYLWVVMIVFGAIVLETLLIYPNIFADPPESLAQTMAFFSVSGPNDFFPPLGFATWVLGAATLLLCWRQRDARWCIVLSLAMMLCEGVASILYFWPRNEIMFVEGMAVHSPEFLVQVAHEFQTWHWRSRMGFNGLAAVAAFVGFLKVHRAHVTGSSTATSLDLPAEVRTIDGH